MQQLLALFVSVAMLAPRMRAEQGSATPLPLTVFFEPRCPDSLALFRKDLKDVVQLFGDRLNVTLNPFGRSKVTHEGDSWNIECRHGANECFYAENIACAIEIQETAGKSAQDFIFCIMDQPTVDRSAPTECAKKTDVDPEELSTCVENQKGIRLLEKHGQRLATAAHPPTGYPTVSLGEDGRHADLKNLKKEICDLLPEDDTLPNCHE